ncbi:MAG: biopolymer transporter ExbD [Lewinella sp.]|nr:biopolymer transporter ExbD [Lewinella sp.]
MGLKRNNKISAEFSMSSLTDIIFLLLIFFMLTSNFVKIQPFELPKSTSKTVAPISIVVAIDHTGNYTLDNQEISGRDLQSRLRTAVREVNDPENTTITIVAEVGTDFDRVTEVMGIAAALRVKAIIATEPIQ